MVNTFLTHQSFRETARNLDRSRLGKERLESIQILNLICDVEFLCNYYSLEQPTFETWKPIVSQLIKLVKSESFRFVQKKTSIREPSKHDLMILSEYPADHVNYIQVPLSLTKQINTSTSCLRAVGLGFVNHPIVKMWFGYADALRAYINAMIEEWVERGYKNTLMSYEVPDDYPRPSWTNDIEFHRIHRSALLDKEITRKEAAWYQLKDEFIEAGPFTGYRWY